MSQTAPKPQHQKIEKLTDKPQPNRRVLVVDDEVAIAEGLKNILMPALPQNVIPMRSSRGTTSPVSVESAAIKSSFEVVVAHNAKDALMEINKAIALGQPFSCGFFDVMLGGGMDGIELVKNVFELDRNIQAVFVTAYNDRSVDSIGEVLGESNLERWGYINKPFHQDEILQKARTLSAHWNLLRMKEWQDERIAEAHRLLLHGERTSTVAAVGRSVAHEFGNILMQIMGNAELALLKNDPERLKSAMETILKASGTASSILGRFKKLAQSGDHAVEHSLVVLGRAMDEALELINFQVRRNNVIVEKNKYESIMVSGHHHSLVQVFMNIFINSLHVMENGGKLKISISKESAEHAVVKIQDTGPGIPEDILPKVIEPLFTTKGDKGTGLGLAICKEIIEIEHSGEFIIENHKDGGVEVIIKLPLQINGKSQN